MKLSYPGPRAVQRCGAGMFLFACLFAGAVAGSAEEPARRKFPAAPVVEGTPRECGRTYGKLYRDGVRAFLDREIYKAFTGKPASREEMLAYASACGKILRADCPVVAEELAGIAEGAGISFDEVVLINLHEELHHRRALPSPGHCTAVAVGPPHTGNQQTYVGQTWDWMQSVAGMSSVVQWRRHDGVTVLAYGFPGMPMGAGLNSHGIALCWTTAYPKQKPELPRAGIPSYALIAHLLGQKDLGGVIREAKKSKHAGWFTFVLADGDGNLLNIEGSPTGVAIERCKERLVRVSYGSAEMTGAKPGDLKALHPRCRKMYDHLDNTKGQNDLARLQQYFTEPTHGIAQGKNTIDMMIFDTTARTAYLSRGASYGAAWRTFTFDAPAK